MDGRPCSSGAGGSSASAAVGRAASRADGRGARATATAAWVASTARGRGDRDRATRSSPRPPLPSATLRGEGIEAWLLTGDARATAEAVARQVGIPAERVIAEVLPEDKAAAIARLRAGGRRGHGR